MNWYLKSVYSSRDSDEDFYGEDGGNELVGRAASEPGSVSDWGKERKIKDINVSYLRPAQGVPEVKSVIEVWQGQFGTRRYLKRDVDGKIMASIIVGKKEKGWQEIMFFVAKPYRKLGHASQIYQEIVKDVGSLGKASEYSPAGRGFSESVRERI
jgi:hypothetical protein